MPASPTNSVAMGAESAGVSEDAVLGGSLTLRQPLRGHRVGHDAILLAAATAAGAGEHAVDLGAGVGAAGLALARRVAGLAVTLVEIEPALAALARENAARNGLAERVRAVCLDVAAPAAAFAAAGLSSGTADRVLMNPPFNTAPAQKTVARSRPASRACRVARYARPVGAHRGAAAAAFGRADADLARRRARYDAGGARRRLRRGHAASGASEAGRGGDPGAGARASRQAARRSRCCRASC